MSSQTPRRNRTWSRPETPSAPAWPAQLSSIFVAGLALLFLAAGLWAAWDYVSWGLSMFKGSERQASTVDSPLDSPTGGDSGRSANATPPETEMRWLPTTRQQPPQVNPDTPTWPETVAAQARAAAKSRQRTIASEGVEALQAADRWVEEASLWRDQIEPLRTDERGRRVAAQARLVDQISALLAEDRPILERATAAQSSLQGLLEPLQKAVDNSSDYSAVDPAVSSEIQRLRTKAREQGERLHKQRVQVEAIVRQAEGLAPSDVTLADAMTRREQEIAATEAAALADRLSTARREAAEAKATAEEEAIRMAGEQQAADIRAQALHEKLIARAKSPDVERYLGTFLAEGYFQPVGRYLSVSYERTAEKTPVSWKRLETCGALDPSVEGLRTLALIASPGLSPPGKWHDRPAWQFDLSKFNWSASDQEFIQKAQDLLRELGPTLVELKMLAP